MVSFSLFFLLLLLPLFQSLFLVPTLASAHQWSSQRLCVSGGHKNWWRQWRRRRRRWPPTVCHSPSLWPWWHCFFQGNLICIGCCCCCTMPVAHPSLWWSDLITLNWSQSTASSSSFLDFLFSFAFIGANWFSHLSTSFSFSLTTADRSLLRLENVKCQSALLLLTTAQ